MSDGLRTGGKCVRRLKEEENRDELGHLFHEHWLTINQCKPRHPHENRVALVQQSHSSSQESVREKRKRGGSDPVPGEQPRRISHQETALEALLRMISPH